MVDYTDLAHTLGTRKRNPYDRRRDWGYGLMKQSLTEQPIDHPVQGIARLAQALVGGWMSNRADQDEEKDRRKRAEEIGRISANPDASARMADFVKLDPDTYGPFAAKWAIEQGKTQEQRRQLNDGDLGTGYGMPPSQPGGAPGGITSAPLAPMSAPQGGTDMSRAGSAISAIESAGGRYDAIGPVANPQGNRAYGKYQVMDFNVGPWTQEVVGKAMSPQEFLANPQAQEAVFRAKFGQYEQQYGPQGAARAWFAGPGGMNNPNAADVNGMTVARYEQKFNQGYGSQQPVQQASAPVPQGDAQQPPLQMAQAPVGQPPAPQPGVVAQAPTPPAVPDIPRPQATREMIEKHNRILRSGGYGKTLEEATPRARAALEAELDQIWTRQREVANKRYEQSGEAFRHERGVQEKLGTPPESFKKLQTESRTLASAINNFEQIIKDQGGGSFRAFINDPTSPQAQKVLGAYQALKTALRSEAFINTGVLQPGENKMLEEMLLSPESIRGWLASPDAYSAKLNEFRRFIDGKMEAAHKSYGMPMTTERFYREPPGAAAPPKPGHVEDGYRFKGGDPGKRENWERAQ